MVFSERGYAAATFQAIAVRADLTRPAINHYFANKQMLYLEVVEQTNTLIVAAAVERAQQETTLIDRLSEFIAAAARYDSEHPSSAAFLLTAVLESRRHPELCRTEADSLRTTREFLTRAIDEAVGNGELAADTDVVSLTEMLLAVLCGVGFYAGFVGSRQQMLAVTAQLQQLMAGNLRCRENGYAPQ